MATKTLKQLLDEGVDSRHILVRSDFNVPLDEHGNITDAGRIDARYHPRNGWRREGA